MSISPFPAEPEPAELLTVEALAEANPMPDELKEQIGAWVEPQTMNCEAEHADVMDAIAIAYPLIREYVLAAAGRERLVHDDPELAAKIRESIDEAERSETRDLGSFAQHLDDGGDDD